MKKLTHQPPIVPDFIMVGGMKCGTTSIHAALNFHPKIYIPNKELHYFDIDDLLEHSDFNFFKSKSWITPNYDFDSEKYAKWYSSNFEINTEGIILGEDSTTYLCSPFAPERIANISKDIKIIIALRQPTARAYSQYWHLLRKGQITYNFENLLRYHPNEIIQRSLYQEQIERYLRCFPRERIHFVIFEDFIQDLDANLKAICKFVGADEKLLPNEASKTHSGKGFRSRFSTLTRLKNYFLRDLANQSYTDYLPFPDEQRQLLKGNIFKRSLAKVHSLVNPSNISGTPPINENTKAFLDNYFSKRLEKIDELTQLDVRSKWFD